MSVGGGHACGVTPGDRMYCWGSNFYGAVGDGMTTRRLEPVAVYGDRAFGRIAASGHTCAVTTGKRAFCRGPNFYGQLGDGTTQQRLRPRRVAGAT